MPRDYAILTLAELLELCTKNIGAPEWEGAWKEFFKRYRDFIYRQVVYRCSRWRWSVPRYQLQKSEIVNDVISKVLVDLCKDECQALRNFQNREDEQKFKGWLGIICVHAADRYMETLMHKRLTDDELEKLVESFKELRKNDYEFLWELFESLTKSLRASEKKKKHNLERDINLFLLYVWADFKGQTLTRLPCFRDIKPHDAEVSVNRSRGYLRRTGLE